MNPVLQIINRVVRSSRVKVNLGVALLSSLGNFSLSFSLMRQLPASEFGRFALAFAAYVLFTGLVRSALLDPLFAVLARQGGQIGSHIQRITLIAWICALATLVLWLVTGRSPYILVLAAAIPGIAVYESLKVSSAVLYRPVTSLKLEAAWCAVTLAGSALVWDGRISPVAGFAVWALSCAAIGFIGAAAMSVPIRPRWGHWDVPTRNLGFFTLDFLAGAGSSQITLGLLAIALTTADVGNIRMAATLLSPIAVIASVASSLLVPYLARSGHGDPRHRLTSALAVTAGLVVVTTPLLIAVIALPEAWLGVVVNTDLGLLRVLIIWLAVEMLLGMVASVPFAGHRAFLAGRESAQRRSVLGVLRILLVVSVSAVFGVLGAVVAMAVVALISASVWWLGFVELIRGSMPEKTGRDS